MLPFLVQSFFETSQYGNERQKITSVSERYPCNVLKYSAMEGAAGGLGPT